MQTTENTTATLYTLIRKGIIQFIGTENECYITLQKSQSQSADWAMKYEGWSVQPFGQSEQFTKYVLDSINLEDYDLENTPKNLLSVAESEKPNGYSKKSRFIYWLQGEPSTFASTTIFEENTALLSSLGINTPESASLTTEMEMLQGMIFDTLTFLSK